METNPKVDAYLKRIEKWQAEATLLRSIVREFPLEEDLKWGQPCYTLAGKNIVLIGGFKDYCVLLFMKGALLPDPKGILMAPGSAQSGRQMRFTSTTEIAKMKPIIKKYIAAAIDVEKSGEKVIRKPHSAYVMPDELLAVLDEKPRLKSAWEKLTPGRQRGYMLHIAGAKQSATRTSRAEKCMPAILEGKGWNE